MKFDVSGTSQAVLFEAARAAELSACSAANEKFRYRLVSLDFLVSSRTNSLKDMLCRIKTKEQEDE
ncbi:hypothetical protein [Leeuwenhoekiella aestuarii]|uniref:hypothetical protein n=1 Tax=Leeuwenhoekiella aestuarii TaxID=2249426 RepID=UPI000FFE7515|nr:hypothetical protein [Leeuwenhoekiella aestuarii]